MTNWCQVTASAERLSAQPASHEPETEAPGLTGNAIQKQAPPFCADPITTALELSELARILGGEWRPRPANPQHRIFLL